MFSNKKQFLLSTFAALLTPGVLLTATDNTNKAGDYNITLLCLMGLMIILLFVIAMLGNTLKQLSIVVKDKNRKEKSDKATAAKATILVIILSLSAIQSFAAEKVAENVAPVSNYISGILKDDFYAIMGVIALELIVIFALVFYTKILLRVISNRPELVAAANAVRRENWFWEKFNAAAPLERERDILLDHDYDGIQELDNSLPPWWKYGFYLTIVVACIYFYRFQISHDGPSQHDEFVAEMQKGDADKAEYLAKSANNVDETTVTLLTDPSEVATGKEIFVKTCAPCHLPDGGGAVGPNLTDEYWLHGGGIKDVFKSIKYGWQDKGMKSWKDDFSPKQIQELASFVKSLRGSHPATAKAPQGDLYIEAGQSSKAADSSKTKSDSTVTRKTAKR